MSEDGQALVLQRVFGTSTATRNGAINLSDAGRTQICVMAGHTAVIYDIISKRQMFLQGHCSAISCLAVTADKLIIVTADEGPGSLLVLWNSRTGNPLCTIRKPHSFGVRAVDFSPDSHFMFTVGAVNPHSNEQEVALWDVSALVNGTSDKPVVTAIVPPGDPQMTACFNINNPDEIITNGKRRAYFWMSQLPNARKFKFYSPPLRAKDFKQRIGDYIMSTFAPGSTQALTSTMDGDVIIWEQAGLPMEAGMRATDRRAIKLLHLHNSPITYLTTVSNFIVTGGADGFVRFYDPMLRIMAWFEDFDAGAIMSLSFSAAPPLKPVVVGSQAPLLNEFMAPDFIVGTSESKVVSVQSAAFDDISGQFPRTGTHLVQAMITEISDLACHPARPEFFVIGSAGLLQRWDFSANTLLGTRQFTNLSGSCLTYSRDGVYVVVGFSTGYLHIVNSNTLEDMFTTRNTNANIHRIAVSATNRHIAAADSKNQVLLYLYLPYKNHMRWEYAGRSRTHHGMKPIIT